MSLSKTTDYDSLEATTRIEDITGDEVNQGTLRSLKDDDGELFSLSLCAEGVVEEGDYHPKSSEELGWLGHFAKKSAHLVELEVVGSTSDIFKNCSEQSEDRFYEDLCSCNNIKKIKVIDTDLADIISKLGTSVNKNFTRWDIQECYLGAVEVNQLFTAFQGIENLEEVSMSYEYDSRYRDVGDEIMARCIQKLAACTRMQELNICGLRLHTNSCAALSTVFPRMAALLEMDLNDNLIGNDGVEVLIRGLAECKHLHSLSLCHNRIGDDGLEMLARGVPASVNTLELRGNEIALFARQLPLLRFKKLDLSGNTLSSDGPRVIAASLANPECRLEALYLGNTSIRDEGAEILATSLRNNQRLTELLLTSGNAITETTGWNVFLPILCDATSIEATHGSNHTLQSLGYRYMVRQDIQTMLDLNSDKNKSSVAATKILQTHPHLDMRPLLDGRLILMPYVVAWLDRFAECRLDLKLSSIYEFARAMPMEVVEGLSGTKKGKKRRRSSA